MLKQMPEQMAPALPRVLSAVVAKLAVAQSSPLVVSLLLVVARLVQMDVSQLVSVLAAMPAPPGAHRQ
jgi:hypothetical protein